MNALWCGDVSSRPCGGRAHSKLKAVQGGPGARSPSEAASAGWRCSGGGEGRAAGTVAAEEEPCGVPMHVQIILLSFCSETGALKSSGVRERMAPLGLGEGHSGSCVSRSPA